MRYLALATDYDGTLASHGLVSEETICSLKKLRNSGRKVILVTGRILEDLQTVFTDLELFDLIVAENGAVLYHPRTRELQLLSEPPPPQFAETLRNLQIPHLTTGKVIVSTIVPFETQVLETIRSMGLELQIIFNKEAVMVLPAGTNKATGLAQALQVLKLSRHEVVGIGDAENDMSFMCYCECSVAVANALPSIKHRATWTTTRPKGDGVSEVIEEIVLNDLKSADSRLIHNSILIGQPVEGEQAFYIPPRGKNFLIAGPSGSGKSTFASGLIERLIKKEYQVCIIDPEGDYANFDEIVSLGDKQHAPSIEEVISLLEHHQVNSSINLLGIPLADRPAFFCQLLPSIQAMKARTGRPHWLVIDEAHHLLPSSAAAIPQALPLKLEQTILITVHPDQIAPSLLSSVELVMAVGPQPLTTLQQFAQSTGIQIPSKAWPPEQVPPGHVTYWDVQDLGSPTLLKVIPGEIERIRHHRKYAEGNLGPHSFYFKGPQGKQNLKAQNLAFFSQISEGIDDETWLYHLKNGDYSRWFMEAIKDKGLAVEAEKIEKQTELSPDESKRKVNELIRAKYTLPSENASGR